MNPILQARDLFFPIMNNPKEAQAFVKVCQDLIKQARDGKESYEKKYEFLANSISAEMISFGFIKDKDLSPVKDNLHQKAKVIKSSQNSFYSLEHFLKKVESGTVLSTHDKARKILFKTQTRQNAQFYLGLCKREIYKAKQQYNPADAKNQCEQLATKLVDILNHGAIVTKQGVPFVAHYLRSKLENSKDYPQQPIPHLEQFFQKLEDKELLSTSNKLTLQKYVNQANAFLSQAMPDLIAHTDVTLLEKQMSEGLWNSLKAYLKPYTFAKIPKMDSALPHSIEAALGFFSMAEMAILNESKKPVSGDGKELRNFFANVGRFLTHFAPYYNDILTTMSDIRKARNEPFTQQPISLDLCNLFLKAGGEAPITAFASVTVPPTLPDFTKNGVLATPKKVLPAAKTPPHQSPTPQPLASPSPKAVSKAQKVESKEPDSPVKTPEAPKAETPKAAKIDSPKAPQKTEKEEKTEATGFSAWVTTAFSWIASPFIWMANFFRRLLGIE